MVKLSYLRQTLSDRKPLGLELLASEFDGLAYSAVIECLKEMQIALRLPIELLRPTDDLFSLIKPPKTRNPLRWHTWRVEFENLEDDLLEFLQMKAKRQGYVLPDAVSTSYLVSCTTSCMRGSTRGHSGLARLSVRTALTRGVLTPRRASMFQARLEVEREERPTKRVGASRGRDATTASPCAVPVLYLILGFKWI